MDTLDPEHPRNWSAARRRDVFRLEKMLETPDPNAKCVICKTNPVGKSTWKIALGPVCAACAEVNNV